MVYVLLILTYVFLRLIPVNEQRACVAMSPRWFHLPCLARAHLTGSSQILTCIGWTSSVVYAPWVLTLHMSIRIPQVMAGGAGWFADLAAPCSPVTLGAFVSAGFHPQGSSLVTVGLSITALGCFQVILACTQG